MPYTGGQSPGCSITSNVKRRKDVTKWAHVELRRMNAHTHTCDLDPYTTTPGKHKKVLHCVSQISRYPPPTYPFQKHKIIMNHLKIIVFTVYTTDIDKSLPKK